MNQIAIILTQSLVCIHSVLILTINDTGLTLGQVVDGLLCSMSGWLKLTCGNNMAIQTLPPLFVE